MPLPKKTNLTEEQTNELISDLLDASFMDNGKRKLARGAVGTASKKFKMTEQNCRRIWRLALTKREQDGTYHYSSLKKMNSGRPALYCREELQASLADLPIGERSTIRDMSRSLGVSVGLCHSLVRNDKVILPHTSALKPILTEENKLKRFLYAMDRVQRQDDRRSWYPAYDEIHVDEKWFFLCQDNWRYYVSLTEKEKQEVTTLRTKHKRHIMKVMFLCAVARPRYNDDGACTFDGKIGIWPFVEWKEAERSSVNRPRGTMELKPISVTRDVYRKYIIEKLLPAVYEKFPRERMRRQVIYLQQDNPNSHFAPNDPEWIQAAGTHPRFKVQMRNQPPNSPDTNLLDLGFFRAIQSLQWKQEPARSIQGLIDNVNKAFSDYEDNKLSKMWLTHQTVCDEILKANGDNDFTIPHVGKDAIVRKEGKLPASLVLSAGARTTLSSTEQV